MGGSDAVSDNVFIGLTVTKPPETIAVILPLYLDGGTNNADSIRRVDRQRGSGDCSQRGSQRGQSPCEGLSYHIFDSHSRPHLGPRIRSIQRPKHTHTHTHTAVAALLDTAGTDASYGASLVSFSSQRELIAQLMEVFPVSVSLHWQDKHGCEGDSQDQGGYLYDMYNTIEGVVFLPCMRSRSHSIGIDASDAVDVTEETLFQTEADKSEEEILGAASISSVYSVGFQDYSPLEGVVPALRVDSIDREVSLETRKDSVTPSNAAADAAAAATTTTTVKTTTAIITDAYDSTDAIDARALATTPAATTAKKRSQSY